jgi:hypothetical protein
MYFGWRVLARSGAPGITGIAGAITTRRPESPPNHGRCDLVDLHSDAPKILATIDIARFSIKFGIFTFRKTLKET